MNKIRPIMKGEMNTKVPIPLICNSVTRLLICELKRLLSKSVELALKYVLSELLYILLLLRSSVVMSIKALEQYLATKGLRVVFVVNKYLVCETVSCRLSVS